MTTHPTGYEFERSYPVPAAAIQAQSDTLLQRAITAYRFWYPTVSVEGVFNGNRTVGIADNEAIGLAASGPRQVGFTLNSDTPYGAGTLDLTSGPMVVELPPGPYIGLLDDHHQRWIMDIGIPGPDGGKGGKHLVLPPDYQGEIPEGYYVGRSSSFKVLIALRALPVHGDVVGAMASLSNVRIYPLSEPSKILASTDVSELHMDSTCLEWEDSIEFWRVLHQIIDAEPIVDEFRPMYGLLSAVGIEKGKPFEPGEERTQLLEEAARLGRAQMLVSAFASNREDRIAWSDRQWEWASLVPDNPDFETSTGIDLEARDRWFIQAIVASPAMFRRHEGAGSLYWLGARDATGDFLDGGVGYTLSLPQPVPGSLFWSVTVYDAETRSQIQTDLDTAALRSMFELADVDHSEPAVLHFGPDEPNGGEPWIKTLPGSGWFAYIRIYGPQKAAFDGSWKPGDFERV